MEPLGEERLEQLRHQVGLVRLLLLDQVLEPLQNRHFDLVWTEFVHFIDDVGVELLHDLLLKVLTRNHQVPQRVEALNAKAVAPNDGQLRQDGEDDVAELKVVVDEELRVLHERFNILLDRMRVLGLRERLQEDNRAPSLLHLLDRLGVII